jgi:HEAT repeat protein
MDERTLAELIQTLGDKEWRKRARAVEALGNSGDKRVLPYLIRALKDRKSKVRMVAAEALANLGDKRAIPHLLKALNDNKRRVLLKMGWALGCLGTLSELVCALNDRRWQVREAAVVGLVEVGKKAVPYLRRALQDQMEEVRARAASALEQLGYQVSYRKREVRLSPVVLGRIKQDFPSKDREEIITMLAQYLERDPEHGGKLVYKIVKLSKGNKKLLAELIEIAIMDRRDILYFWEVQRRWEKQSC